MWRMAAIGLVILLSIAAWAATPAPSPADTRSPAPPRLIIDYGDGVEKHFTALPCGPGATVLDLLKAAAAHPRGIDVEYRGSGETAFLTRIDDLTNEGTGRGRRNWIYYVNDKPATRSMGVQPVRPGDRIRWAFRTGAALESVSPQQGTGDQSP